MTLEHHYQQSYALQLFFDNDGGDCYIVLVGPYADSATMTTADLEAGVDAIPDFDGATLVLFPYATLMGEDDLTELRKKMQQCAERHDRFGVFGLDESAGYRPGVTVLRNDIGQHNLKYGAAYTQYLRTSIPVQFSYQDVRLEQQGETTDLATVTAAAGIDTTAVTAVDTAVANGAPQETINCVTDDLKNTNAVHAGIVTALTSSTSRILRCACHR